MTSPRRLLIISTTFFPDPAVAAIRMTQWCKHLPQYGWTPHVLCRYYGFHCSAEELAAKVHPGVRLEYLDRPGDPVAADKGVRFAKKLLRRAAGLALRHRGIATLLVPDPSVLFWDKHRERILERVRAIQPDVILTTSPAHGNHAIGLWLAAETGIPWVADFRDPYVIDNRFQAVGLGLLRWATHHRFERAIYHRARLITHAIPFQARWARRQYPLARARIRTLTNGFPLEMLEHVGAPRATAGGRRSICVMGAILKTEQLQLARAIACLVAQGEDVELRFVGKPPHDLAPFRTLLGDRFVATGYVPHADSVRLVAGAAVLVNFLNAHRSASWLLSTKLFEYLASDRPVVLVNPSRSDRLLLRRVSGVRVVWQPSVEELKEALLAALQEPDRADPAGVERFRSEFNWAGRAHQLAGWLDELVSIPPERSSASRGRSSGGVDGHPHP